MSFKVFILNNNSVEKIINIQQDLFFSFLKEAKSIKQKKIIKISLIIMVVKMTMLMLVKMTLLILLVLSQYGPANKYRTTSQISIYNWIQNYIFWYFWYCIFTFLRSNYNSEAISTCCRNSDGLSHDELRAVTSAQIAVVHIASSGRQLK